MVDSIEVEVARSGRLRFRRVNGVVLDERMYDDLDEAVRAACMCLRREWFLTPEGNC
jgi:hypothetical protein